MKRIVIFLSLILALVSVSCGKLGRSNSGELVGVASGKPWNDPKPFGMTYIAGGSFLMGPNDQSANLEDVPTPRAVSISSFWMDETEITNSEYRQFTNWVTDSIARSRLADPGIGARDEFYMKQKGKKGEEVDPDKPRPLDWQRKIPWDNSKGDEGINTALEDLYYQGGDVIESDNEVNTSKLNFAFRWVDYQAASLPENKFDVNNGGFIKSLEDMPIGGDSADYMVRKDSSYFDGNRIITSSFYTPLTSRSAFIQSKIVNVFPDTMCWMRDYTDSYNEPMMKMYFNHPGYSQYPVVGVSWEQADAFCRWRTGLQKMTSGKSKKQKAIVDYNLPSEAQWEYAARGGKEQALYPWGGNYIRNKNGCFLANYKPLRGRYSDDGYSQTAQVESFPPNDYGLYDMAGNVAEWTADRFDESSYELMHDMNPSYQYNAKKSDPDVLKRKVIRGGSWKDIGYYLECGTRTFEYQYEARSYIGFRCIKTYVGPRLFK